MLEMLQMVLAEILLIVWVYCFMRFFRNRLYRNNNLLLHTPVYDEENVFKKHDTIWKRIRIFCFFPLILVVAEIILYFFASTEIFEGYGKIRTTIMFATIIASLPSLLHIERNGFSKFYLLRYGDDGTYPFVIGRYMVYPANGYSSACITTITLSVVAVFVAVFSVFFQNQYLALRNSVETPTYIKFFEFLLSLAVLFWANYSIIFWYENTPRENVLNEATEDEYGTIARRYYSIWRKRLIIANAVCAVQFVLTCCMVAVGKQCYLHLANLGAFILVVVFSYILIQSREFEDPVVVRGMVYPSEKKRVALKWVILSAIALYTLGAIILL